MHRRKICVDTYAFLVSLIPSSHTNMDNLSLHEIRLIRCDPDGDFTGIDKNKRLDAVAI